MVPRMACMETASAESHRFPENTRQGAGDWQVIVPHRRRTANCACNDYLDHCHNDVKTCCHHRRAPTCSICLESWATDVQRRCRQGESSNRKGNIGRRSQETGEKLTRRLHAQSGFSRSMRLCCRVMQYTSSSRQCSKDKAADIHTYH